MLLFNFIAFYLQLFIFGITDFSSNDLFNFCLCSYDEAVNAVRREIGLLQQIENVAPIGRLGVILVLLHLARRDYVAAEKAFKEWGNCCEQAEVSCY